MPSESSSESDSAPEKSRELRFAGLMSGRPVLVVRTPVDVGLAGVRTEMPGVRG